MISKFLEGESLPAEYYDQPDPYSEPPVSKYNLRVMVNYAMSIGKKVMELTNEEADRFLVNP